MINNVTPESLKLKYILIGDVEQGSIIGDYPNSISLNVMKDGRTIFEKIVASNYSKFGERIKVGSNEGKYFCVVSLEKLFFFGIDNNFNV
jgi:hypothetical protein